VVKLYSSVSHAKLSLHRTIYILLLRIKFIIKPIFLECIELNHRSW